MGITKKIIVSLVFIYVIKSVLWAMIIPVFQTPDENRHYNYVAHLAKRGTLPLAETAHIGPTYVLEETVFLEQLTDFDRVHFSPRAKATFFLNDSLWQQVKRYQENDRISDYEDPENIYMGFYPPLYYMLGALVYRVAMIFDANLLVRFYALRLFQIVVSALIPLLGILLLKALGYSKRFIVAFSLILMFWPQFSMFTIGLQPDVLATVLTLGIGLLYIKHFQQGVPGFYWKLGLLYGALLLIKFHLFLIMASLAAFYFFYEWIRLKRWSFKIIISIFTPLLLAVPWFFHNFVHYGVLLPHAKLGSIENLSLFRRFWYFLSVAKKSTFPTSVGYFGWRDTRMPDWFYVLFYALILVASVGVFYLVIKYLMRYFKEPLNSGQKIREMFNTDIPHFIIYLPMVLHIALMLYLSMTISPYLNDQGRQYFPQIFALLLLFLMGSRAIWKSENWGNRYLLFIAILVICSNVFSLVMIWQRYYLA